MNERWRQTYDAWKLRSPDDDREFAGDKIGTCDVCDRRKRSIRKAIVHNIETYVCEECS